MKIYSVVEEAVNLVLESLEANHETSDSDSIRRRIYSWYNHSDVTDPETLAACALEGVDWSPAATYNDMISIKNLWFPEEKYAIWEIEAAQHDSMWW